MFTSTSSFTNVRLCCFDASMNHKSDGKIKESDGGKEKKGVRVKASEVEGDRQIREIRFDFFFSSRHSFIYTASPRPLARVLRNTNSKSSSVSNQRYSFWRLYPHAIIS